MLLAESLGMVEAIKTSDPVEGKGNLRDERNAQSVEDED